MHFVQIAVTDESVYALGADGCVYTLTFEDSQIGWRWTKLDWPVSPETATEVFNRSRKDSTNG